VIELLAMNKEEAALATKKIPKNLESAVDLVQYLIIPLLPKQTAAKK